MCWWFPRSARHCANNFDGVVSTPVGPAADAVPAGTDSPAAAAAPPAAAQPSRVRLRTCPPCAEYASKPEILSPTFRPLETSVEPPEYRRQGWTTAGRARKRVPIPAICDIAYRGPAAISESCGKRPNPPKSRRPFLPRPRLRLIWPHCAGPTVLAPLCWPDLAPPQARCWRLLYCFVF